MVILLYIANNSCGKVLNVLLVIQDHYRLRWMTILTNSNRVQLKTSAFIMVSSNRLLKANLMRVI